MSASAALLGMADRYPHSSLASVGPRGLGVEHVTRMRTAGSINTPPSVLRDNEDPGCNTVQGPSAQTGGSGAAHLGGHHRRNANRVDGPSRGGQPTMDRSVRWRHAQTRLRYDPARVLGRRRVSRRLLLPECVARRR